MTASDADWSSSPEFVLETIRSVLGLDNEKDASPSLVGQVGSLYVYMCGKTNDETKVAVVSPFLAFRSSVIARHFELTPTQVKVAGLLACRRSNCEIATALRISPNTARRHTEAVMFRMKAASRSDVEWLIKRQLENRRAALPTKPQVSYERKLIGKPSRNATDLTSPRRLLEPRGPGRRPAPPTSAGACLRYTLGVVDALIKANKDFDMLIVPDAAHGLPDYTIRKQWDYFVRHLLGVEPPAGYRMMDRQPFSPF